MTDRWPIPIDGGCDCGALRYRLHKAPVFVHCCNCRQCQRQTGSAFTLSAIVEKDQVTVIPGNQGEAVETKLFLLPTESGLGQLVARCPRCFVAVWSIFGGAGPMIKFIRGGTLDKQSVDGRSVEEALRPDIYIYTKLKQPWVEFPRHAKTGDMIMEEFYNPAEKWPKDGLERFGSLRAEIEEWNKCGNKWEDVFPDFVDCR